MNYNTLRSVADNLINNFSNNQTAILMKAAKTTNPITGKVTKNFTELVGLAVMTNYNEEAISKSDSVIEAGDVKFVCRFSEKPIEQEDRIKYAGVEYNIINCNPVDPTGALVVTYIIQGRKA